MKRCTFFYWLLSTPRDGPSPILIVSVTALAADNKQNKGEGKTSREIAGLNKLL